MTFPLRHIPSSLPFFVGPSLGPPHLLPFIGQLSVFCWPRVFSFRLSKRGAPSPLSLSNRRLGKSEEGAGGGCRRLQRSTEGGQRAAAAVESRDREQFVSQSHGWAAAARAGSRDHLRPRARPAGPRIHAALLSRGVLSTGRRTTAAACGTKRRGRSRGEPSRTLQIFAERPERERNNRGSTV